MQTRQNENTIKCKCDKMQVRQNANTTKWKHDKMQTRKNVNAKFQNVKPTYCKSDKKSIFGCNLIIQHVLVATIISLNN